MLTCKKGGNRKLDVDTEVKSEWIGDGATKQKNRGDKQEEKNGNNICEVWCCGQLLLTCNKTVYEREGGGWKNTFVNVDGREIGMLRGK